jgi:hypothetical protein
VILWIARLTSSPLQARGVASELGHTSPQMLYSTYRELVAPEEAEQYWQITPAAEAPKVVTFSA